MAPQVKRPPSTQYRHPIWTLAKSGDSEARSRGFWQHETVEPPGSVPKEALCDSGQTHSSIATQRW